MIRNEEKMGGADIMSSEAEQTIVNSETEEKGDTITTEEQTFRPGHRNKGKSYMQSQDLPL